MEVSGIFEAGKTAVDSEIWVDINQVAGDFNRDHFRPALAPDLRSGRRRTLIHRVEDTAATT